MGGMGGGHCDAALTSVGSGDPGPVPEVADELG
jgi:hypothetical protein